MTLELHLIEGVALFVALTAAELNSLVLNPLVANLMFDRNNIEFLQAAKVSRLVEDDEHEQRRRFIHSCRQPKMSNV